MNNSSTVLLIGGPATGKTNYMMRLWLAMDTGKGCLRKDTLPEQLEYLRAGAQMLLRGRFAERTLRGAYTKTEIPCQLTEGGSKSTLVIPDVSGEDCDKVFSERQWNKDWEGSMSQCVGCLVFLREGVLHAPLSWIDVAQSYGIMSEQKEEVDQPFPTQTILVEWLQFFREALDDLRGHSFIPRVAIIIAAWDELGDEVTERGPDAFLAEYAPLMYHFIQTNRDRFEVMVFGTSVVGGDLAQDLDFRQRYLDGNPHESGYAVYTSEGVPKRIGDITLPVAWILGNRLD